MEALNIAFYTDSFLPARDGVVTSILNFRNELEKRGHTVYIFASGNRSTKKYLERHDNVFVMRSLKFNKYPQYNVALAPFLSSLKLKQLEPDIIHAHTPFTMGVSALALARLNKIPITSTFHTLFTDKGVISNYLSRRASRVLSVYSWKYARFFYNRCNSVIAPSGNVEQLLTSKGIGNVKVVPNSVDIKKFNPKVDGSALKRKLLGNDHDKLVLYVGRISREKKISVLLRAAKRISKSDKNVKFVLAGTGPAASHYASMAQRLGLGKTVKFEGFVSDSMLPKYYAAADAFCIPSTFETQGIVSLEAMACGKPVVGADWRALHELIKDGKNGEKFKAGDSAACARKLEKVLNNIGSYKETVTTARQYSIEATTDKLLKVYRETINDMTV
jgi:1,2-diacylglycerol 3-alpha-glucosyltransferase